MMMKFMSAVFWKDWGFILAAWLLVFDAQGGGNIHGVIASVEYQTLSDPEYLFVPPTGPPHQQVSLRVMTAFTSSPGPSVQYRHSIRLLDALGNIVPLPGSGAANVLSFGPFTIAPALGEATRTDGLLSPYHRYHVEATLEYLPGGAPVSEGGIRNAPDRQLIYFPNRASGDPSRNVISEIRSVRWTRNFAVDTAADDNQILEAEVTFRLHRYDDIAAPLGAAEVPVRFQLVMETGHGMTFPAMITSGLFLAWPPSPWVLRIAVCRESV